jgi:uncharacterized membrane protein YgcG
VTPTQFHLIILSFSQPLSVSLATFLLPAYPSYSSLPFYFLSVCHMHALNLPPPSLTPRSLTPRSLRDLLGGKGEDESVEGRHARLPAAGERVAACRHQSPPHRFEQRRRRRTRMRRRHGEPAKRTRGGGGGGVGRKAADGGEGGGGGSGGAVEAAERLDEAVCAAGVGRGQTEARAKTPFCAVGVALLQSL